VGFVVAFAVSASADAATIAVVPDAEQDKVLYLAEPGEENRLKADSAGGLITVRDNGAQVIAGAECVQVSAHEATCQRNAAFPVQLLSAQLGNGDDRADATTGIRWYPLEGGAGDDDLEGGESFDQLNGDAGADRIDGGGSMDFAGYPGRPDDLDITLNDSAANDGGAEDGSGDRLLSIESATGGDGDDHIVGDAGENTLGGGKGADVLEGAEHEDGLFGGEGADTLRGQGGPDEMQAQSGADKAFGGAAADIFIVEADGRPDLVNGGGNLEDELQLGTGSYRIELDGKANDGQCDQSPCSTADEGDDIRGITIVNGAFGSDLLIGSAGHEFFEPGLGADVVRAKGGDDEVSLHSGDGADDVNCGGGVDTVDGEQLEDTLTACEN
jgi:Ca2+-binding RTX toxin-like protein